MYEERLGNNETKRYELEDQVASLEEQLRAAARPSSPTSLAKYASSAAQIENETLQDQVTHLQNKIRTLEDMLEDARAAAEKDELVVRERIKRYKDKEDSMKKEAAAAKKEMESLIRAEEQARQRLGEIEEAFRENQLTLENARAEIETLRGELVVSGSGLHALFSVIITFCHSGYGGCTGRSNSVTRSNDLRRKEETRGRDRRAERKARRKFQTPNRTGATAGRRTPGHHHRTPPGTRRTIGRNRCAQEKGKSRDHRYRGICKTRPSIPFVEI